VQLLAHLEEDLSVGDGGTRGKFAGSLKKAVAEKAAPFFQEKNGQESNGDHDGSV
jgi:hypothetical protein